MLYNNYDYYNDRWSDVTFYLDANGQASGTDGYYANQWLTPVAAGVGAGYEVRFTAVNSTAGWVGLHGGSYGTWLPLNTPKYLYTLSPITIGGDPPGVILVEIRAIGGSTILASANITFQ